MRRRAICSGVAASPAMATAGSDGTAWISRKVTTSSPSSDGRTSDAAPQDEAQHRQLSSVIQRISAPWPDGAEAAALDPLVEALELHGVVDPDVRAVGHDLADRLLVERRALLLLDLGARLAQQRVDLVVLVVGRRLPGAVELAVVHLADPVLGIDEVGRDPVHPHVGRGLGLGGCGGQVRPDVADDLEVDADLRQVALEELGALHALLVLRLHVQLELRASSARPRRSPWRAYSLAFFRS